MRALPVQLWWSCLEVWDLDPYKLPTVLTVPYHAYLMYGTLLIYYSCRCSSCPPSEMSDTWPFKIDILAGSAKFISYCTYGSKAIDYHPASRGSLSCYSATCHHLIQTHRAAYRDTERHTHTHAHTEYTCIATFVHLCTRAPYESVAIREPSVPKLERSRGLNPFRTAVRAKRTLGEAASALS